MLDRFGNKVSIGYSEIELIWIEAANSLRGYERSCALYDISEMTGRSVSNIREKANLMRAEKTQQDWLRNAPAMASRADRGRPGGMPPSDLARPSLGRLMGSKAFCRHTDKAAHENLKEAVEG